jgi:hypothetical protein
MRVARSTPHANTCVAVGACCPFKSKGTVVDDWEKLRLDEADLPQYFGHRRMR